MDEKLYRGYAWGKRLFEWPGPRDKMSVEEVEAVSAEKVELLEKLRILEEIFERARNRVVDVDSTQLIRADRDAA